MADLQVKIWYTNRQKTVKVTPELKKLIKSSILETLRMEDRKGRYEVGVTFTDNEGIRELNRTYRNLDRPTDVLSFPLLNEEELNGTEDRPVLALGDIVLSMEKALEQAELYGHGTDREVAFLTAHSMLHLLGYDHELSDEDDRLMRSKQDEVMKRMGLEVR